MKTRFRFARILMLIFVVLMLSFVYFMVRAGYSFRLSDLQNPSGFGLTEVARETAALPNPETAREGGWLVVEGHDDIVSPSLRPAVELAIGALGYEPTYTGAATAEQLGAATQGVIISGTALENMGDIQLILEYAREGGMVTFAVRPEVEDVFRNIYQQLGIYEHAYYAESKGFHLQAGLLTEKEFSVEGDWLSNSILELHVGKNCRIYAENDAGVPLIWSLDYGKGSILVMNNSLMTYKATGGLLPPLWAEMSGRPLIYPVINARVFALESFPLPSDVNIAYMKETYLRSTQAFLRDVWWNDIVSFSRVRRIPITAGFLSGYDQEESHSSPAVLNEEMNLIFYGKELAKYGGELAFTGFNQRPLYFREGTAEMRFTRWSSEQTAEQRLGEAFDFFGSYFPEYALYAYLPPERVLDAAGYEMIKRQMPDLQVISGDFYDRALWYQDFGIGEDGIVSFPVVTSGFNNSHINRWNLLGTANALGVVFHSADASDLVLETDPSKSWTVQAQQWFAFSEETLAQTDYLEGMTLTKAAQRLREKEQLIPKITVTDDRIDVEIPEQQMPQEASFMLFSPGKRAAAPVGVELKELGDGRYLVTTNLSAFTIELKSN